MPEQHQQHMYHHPHPPYPHFISGIGDGNFHGSQDDLKLPDPSHVHVPDRIKSRPRGRNNYVRGRDYLEKKYDDENSHSNSNSNSNGYDHGDGGSATSYREKDAERIIGPRPRPRSHPLLHPQHEEEYYYEYIDEESSQSEPQVVGSKRAPLDIGIDIPESLPLRDLTINNHGGENVEVPLLAMVIVMLGMMIFSWNLISESTKQSIRKRSGNVNMTGFGGFRGRRRRRTRKLPTKMKRSDSLLVRTKKKTDEWNSDDLLPTGVPSAFMDGEACEPDLKQEETAVNGSAHGHGKGKGAFPRLRKSVTNNVNTHTCTDHGRNKSFVSSVSASHPHPTPAPYSLGQAGLEGFDVNVVAVPLSPTHVGVGRGSLSSTSTSHHDEVGTSTGDNVGNVNVNSNDNHNDDHDHDQVEDEDEEMPTPKMKSTSKPSVAISMQDISSLMSPSLSASNDESDSDKDHKDLELDVDRDRDMDVEDYEYEVDESSLSSAASSSMSISMMSISSPRVELPVDVKVQEPLHLQLSISSSMSVSPSKSMTAFTSKYTHKSKSTRMPSELFPPDLPCVNSSFDQKPPSGSRSRSYDDKNGNGGDGNGGGGNRSRMSSYDHDQQGSISSHSRSHSHSRRASVGTATGAGTVAGAGTAAAAVVRGTDHIHTQGQTQMKMQMQGTPPVNMNYPPHGHRNGRGNLKGHIQGQMKGPGPGHRHNHGNPQRSSMPPPPPLPVPRYKLKPTTAVLPLSLAPQPLAMPLPPPPPPFPMPHRQSQIQGQKGKLIKTQAQAPAQVQASPTKCQEELEIAPSATMVTSNTNENTDTDIDIDTNTTYGLTTMPSIDYEQGEGQGNIQYLQPSSYSQDSSGHENDSTSMYDNEDYHHDHDHDQHHDQQETHHDQHYDQHNKYRDSDHDVNGRNANLEDENDADSDKGETEGANGVFHKRRNLTSWSDAASSLHSPISFAELKMKSLIGGGGFGQVWSATWRGTPVAVKVLSAITDPQTKMHVQKAILQEFAAEINLLSGMRHPNICLYIGACLEPTNRAIVTELAANGSLWDALRLPLQPPFAITPADGMPASWPFGLYDPHIFDRAGSGSILSPPPSTWPWALVRRVAEGAARGMNYLHCGMPAVLHRDLKSANILLDDSYNPKVCDFGLSRLKAQEKTMTGNCGTVQWMAPEILANEKYAEPADVFSYGIILWELLKRECPYDGMSSIQCALAVLNKDMRPEIPDWCPEKFASLIRSCIAKDPSKRPTFSDILHILDSMPK